jgi:hypothetical protein
LIPTCLLRLIDTICFFFTRRPSFGVQQIRLTDLRIKGHRWEELPHQVEMSPREAL